MASIKPRSTAGGARRYDVRWRLPDGSARSKAFDLRRNAEAFKRTVEAEELAGVVVDRRAGRQSVSQLAEVWLRSNPTKRASSLLRDETITRCHVLPALGSTSVGAVTRADVQRLVDGWAVPQAASTVGRQYSCLRAMFAYAEAAEMIGRTPCRGIRLPKTSLVERPALDADQLERLADALGPDQAPMMWLGAVGGLRWGECAALAVGGVDLLAGRVTVSQQLGRDGQLGPPKSQAGIRRLAIPTWLIEELAALLSRRGLTGADSSAPIFVGATGRPLDYTNWRVRAWLPACEKAGLGGLRFHDLRSLAATALVAAGVDIKTAQTRLGHSSPQMTLGLYARATVEADRAAADAVGRRIRPCEPRAKDASVGRSRRRPAG